MANQSYAVLGLGRFGRGVALALAQNGEEVMIVDKESELIEQYAPQVTYAITADLADEEAVQELGLGNMDAVIVGMGMDLEASILCVMVAKESGVGQVIAKAANKRMGDILLRVGADRIIYPEEEMGKWVAMSLISAKKKAEQ
jgi:trk system potassium uptake protein TrkA